MSYLFGNGRTRQKKFGSGILKMEPKGRMYFYLIFSNQFFSSKAILISVSITECDANVTFKTKAVTRRFPDRLETIRSDCDQMNRLLDVFSFARDETANVLDQLNNFY